MNPISSGAEAANCNDKADDLLANDEINLTRLSCISAVRGGEYAAKSWNSTPTYDNCTICCALLRTYISDWANMYSGNDQESGS